MSKRMLAAATLVALAVPLAAHAGTPFSISVGVGGYGPRPYYGGYAVGFSYGYAPRYHYPPPVVYVAPPPVYVVPYAQPGYYPAQPAYQQPYPPGTAYAPVPQQTAPQQAVPQQPAPPPGPVTAPY